MRNGRLYLDDIIQACNKIINYTDNISHDDFIKDDKTIDAVVRNLIIIGEAARLIPNDIKKKLPELDWPAIIGLRNIVTHEYFGVDVDEIWKTIQEDIPLLKQSVMKIKDT